MIISRDARNQSLAKEPPLKDDGLVEEEEVPKKGF